MSFSARMRYLLISAAIVVAGAVQLVRGYRPLIVILGAGTFLVAGNLIVYLSGAKDRARRRKQKRDYYAGNA